jgi:hypothetical protein
VVDDIKVMDESEPIIVPTIILSDQVIREAGTQKLTIVGMFSQWNCPTFPFQTPAFWVTPILSNFHYTEKEINITVRIEAANGHVLASISPKIKFANPNMKKHDTVEIPLQVPSIVLTLSGIYQIVVLIDGDIIGKRHFFVNSVTAASI